jgi:hypothetical protein
MRLRFRIVNKTHYDSRVLRRLVAWCIRHAGAEGRTRKVTFNYTRQDRGCSGYAWLNGSSVVMRLIKSKTDGINAAQVLLHEIDHNLGLEHKDMVPSRTIALPGFPADLMALVEMPPKSKPAPDAVERVAGKLAAVEAKVKEWESKLRRTRTWLKKWERRARYYRAKVAAAAQAPRL